MTSIDLEFPFDDDDFPLDIEALLRDFPERLNRLKRLSGLSKETISERVAYLPQENSTGTALTVFEALLLARKHDMSWRLSGEDLEVAASALRDSQIEHISLKYLNELSGGQKQMVSIAQVLVRRPRLLLSDEPTSSLDLHHQLDVITLLSRITAEREIITIVSLHDLNLAARFGDNILVLHDGRVYAHGDAVDVLTAEMLRDVYGVHATVHTGQDGIPQITPHASIKHRADQFPRPSGDSKPVAK